jgi:hypothetical protein
MEDDSELPRFSGPAELKVLGHWVSGDIQLVGLSILEAIDLVRLAQSDAGFAPEDLTGNAFTATISPQEVTIENHFLEQVRGAFPLDKALVVLLDFWDYFTLASPDKCTSCWNEYVRENGRDPLAGLREITA